MNEQRWTRLLRELTEADAAVETAENAVSEARGEVMRRRYELVKAQLRKREVELEMLGKSQRPILDAISAREDAAAETADERQRGPTLPARITGPISEPAKERGRKPREKADHKIAEKLLGVENRVESERPVEWTSADLEYELKRALIRPLGYLPRAEWDEFRRPGKIADVQVMEVLRAIWPQGYGCDPVPLPGEKRTHGYTIHGGVNPGFWIGARKPTTMNKPTLEGSALADRVRAVLGMSRPLPPALEPDADGNIVIDPMAAAKRRQWRIQSASRMILGFVEAATIEEAEALAAEKYPDAKRPFQIRDWSGLGCVGPAVVPPTPADKQPVRRARR